MKISKEKKRCIWQKKAAEYVNKLVKYKEVEKYGKL
jgi:hypothetical protein